MLSQISRPAVLAGLVLLLGALVLIFLPSIRNEVALVGAGASSEVASKLALQSSPGLLPAAALGDPPATKVLRVESGDLMLTGTRESAASGEAAGVSTDVVPVNGDIPASSAVPVALFNATGESWVKVTDAKGAVVLNRTLKAGEAAEVSGVLPLFAIVGRVDVTQVQVRGQSFDLSAVSKNNVARFEVK